MTGGEKIALGLAAVALAAAGGYEVYVHVRKTSSSGQPLAAPPPATGPALGPLTITAPGSYSAIVYVGGTLAITAPTGATYSVAPAASSSQQASFTVNGSPGGSLPLGQNTVTLTWTTASAAVAAKSQTATVTVTVSTPPASA